MPAQALDIDQLTALIDRLTAELEQALEAATDRLDKAGRRLERDLYAILTEVFLSELTIKENKVAKGAANYNRLTLIDRAFYRFQLGAMVEQLGYLPGAYLEFAELASRYFQEMEIGAPAKVKAIAANNAVIRARLGLEATGQGFVSGGYMADLFAMADVRQRVKSLAIATIAGEPSLKTFQKAMRSLVIGSGEEGGIVSRFLRERAYDTFNQIHELKNQEFADALELKHFLYAGSVIDNTRTFCRQKVGKVFTTAQALKQWPNDPDLVGKNRPEPYFPLIERGRWNCRHFIKYISPEMYEAMKQKEAA